MKDDELKLLLLVLLAGSFGGFSSFIWAIYVGSPVTMSALPGLSVQSSTLVLCVTLGCIAAIGGNYFVSPTGTFRSFALAVLCGFGWKPSIEAIQARIESQAIFDTQRSTGALKDTVSDLGEKGLGTVGATKDATIRVVEALHDVPASQTRAAATKQVSAAVQSIARAPGNTEDRFVALTAVTKAAQTANATELAQEAFTAAKTVVDSEPDPVKRASYTVTLEGIKVGPGETITLPTIVIPRPKASPTPEVR